MSDPIISLKNIVREFPAGNQKIQVLKGVDIDIEAGEMVAIIGQSGSGKTTLMNIIGCLDQANSGTYLFKGRDISTFGADELAELRREHFGFIFQRYQLLPDLSAVENAEVPAIYAGARTHARRSRAKELLTRLGLGDRLTHRPAQLSGGQQQRVSVARALINGGEIILADEPTGALDSHSGEELIGLITELHQEGHTIIMVTHDPAIASRAERIIEIKDGEIIADHPNGGNAAIRSGGDPQVPLQSRFFAGLSQFTEALSMAVRALLSHRLRTFLTMLGIIIGIAAVVGVVALGQGSQQTVLENIASIGTNTINVRPGTGFGDRTSGAIHTLTDADADALAKEPYAQSVTPDVSTSKTVFYRNISASAVISGVGSGYFDVNGSKLSEGVLFGKDAVETYAQDAVIDQTTQTTLFPDGGDPLGKVIILGQVPVRIVGVVENSSGFGPSRDRLNIYIPYTTAMARILGQTYLSSITVRVRDDYDIDQAQTEIEQLMLARHGTKDFFLMNTNTIRETITSTTQTLTALISAIAVISLMVGGIGVMNIMLVSVTERTREIGVRMAVGARRGDIMQQFLIEAVLVCLVGGTIGVGLALGAGAVIGQFAPSVKLIYSTITIAAAFASSTLIGIVFGFMPARSAARLNPVDALARE